MRDTRKAPPPSIFLCYRRNDSADVTGRIYDRLAQDFRADRVFMDAESMDCGINFRTRVHKALSECQVALVIIGPSWTTIRDEKTGLRRLDEEEDNVRFEVETALSRPDLHVIPVRVNGASWPLKKELPESIRALADLNGPEVRRNPDFHHDMDKLVSEIGQYVPRKSPALRSILLCSVAASILGLLGWLVYPDWHMQSVIESVPPLDSIPQAKVNTSPAATSPPAPPETLVSETIAPVSQPPVGSSPQVGESQPTIPPSPQLRSKSRVKPIEDNSPVIRTPSTVPVYQYNTPKNRTIKPVEPTSK